MQSDLERIEQKLDFIIDRLSIMDMQDEANVEVAKGTDLVAFYKEQSKEISSRRRNKK